VRWEVGGRGLGGWYKGWWADMGGSITIAPVPCDAKVGSIRKVYARPYPIGSVKGSSFLSYYDSIPAEDDC
jgi:hypothetical protein